MSSQEVDPFFVRQLLVVLEHWQEQAATQDKAVLDRLDDGRQNLFHIVNLGLEHSQTQTAAARLSLAVFPLVEQRGYWSEWIPVLERAIELQGTEVSLLLFHLHNRLGQLYRWERKIDKAIEAHLATEAAAENLADDHAAAIAWFNLAEDYSQIQQFDESEKYGLLALDVFTRLAVDNVWLAMIYNTLGTIAHGQNRLALAESRLRNAVSIWRQTDDSVGLVRSIINLANSLRSAQKFEEALAHYEEAGSMLRESSWTPEQPLIQITLGGLYYDLGQLDKAELAYRQALSSDLSRIEYTYYQAYALQGLGNVLLQMERYNEAEPLLENAISCWYKLKDDLNLANSLGTLAETAVGQQEFDQAAKLYKKAIGLVKNRQDVHYGQILLEELEAQLQGILDGSLEGGTSKPPGSTLKK